MDAEPFCCALETSKFIRIKYVLESIKPQYTISQLEFQFLYYWNIRKLIRFTYSVGSWAEKTSAIQNVQPKSCNRVLEKGPSICIWAGQNGKNGVKNNNKVQTAKWQLWQVEMRIARGNIMPQSHWNAMHKALSRILCRWKQIAEIAWRFPGAWGIGHGAWWAWQCKTT